MVTLCQFIMEQDDQEIVQVMDAKFKKACQQLRLLNSWIERLQTRYDGAASANKRSHRYSLRIKLCVIEGVRNMFYEYALRMADKLDEMRQQMGLLDNTDEDREENTTDDDNDEEDDSDNPSMEDQEDDQDQTGEDEGGDTNNSSSEATTACAT